MIILTKETLSKNDELTSLVEHEKEYLNKNIELQKNLKEILLEYMQKFADSTNNINSEYADIILQFLEDLKSSLNLCNDNINSLTALISSFDNLLADVDKHFSDLDYISECNSDSAKHLKSISENILHIEMFLHSLLSYSELNFFSSSKSVSEISQDNGTYSCEKDSNLDRKNKESDISSENKSFDFVENTLIVSETKGKIFLPYNISYLKGILENSLDKYSSLEDIIEKEYTLPLSSFKNLSIARFREAFKLVRNKEKKSIKAAFDLGMELLFNYNLHPAIISACKNIDELDIYLDYLDNNETDKFDCFKIVFDMAPVLVKQKS